MPFSLSFCVFLHHKKRSSLFGFDSDLFSDLSYYKTLKYSVGKGFRICYKSLSLRSNPGFYRDFLFSAKPHLPLFLIIL